MTNTEIKPGDQVLIIEDCREGGPATGQTATYEGHFPLVDLATYPEFSISNPRFRLPDGSEIWGIECWWTLYEEGLTLETAQAEVEETKAHLRAWSDYWASTAE